MFFTNSELRIKVMPTTESLVLLREDEELMSRREHNRIVQAILASRGARPVETAERPEDPQQAFSLVSEESVIVVSDSDDGEVRAETDRKWELITNKLLTAWELDNRKVAIQNLRTYWSTLGQHLRTHPWVCQYREKRYVAVYRQATVKRWEFRQ